MINSCNSIKSVNFSLWWKKASYYKLEYLQQNANKIIILANVISDSLKHQILKFQNKFNIWKITLKDGKFRQYNMYMV